MSNVQYYELPEFASILGFIDAIFSELNMGLFIYHAESLRDPSRLRLVYANREASRCTGIDLGGRVGKYIGEAFPPLLETDIPQRFLDVANSKESRTIGLVDYADHEMRQRQYEVRSFPMPADCIGILFADLPPAERDG